MDDLIFTPHALDKMAGDRIPVEAVYHVIGDGDEIIEQIDGRTIHTGVWEGRVIAVVIEGDGFTVVTVWERKRDSRRHRHGRRGRWS